MRKIRDVLRLSAAGLSKRQIAASLGIGPTAAGACLRRAREAGVGWPLPDDLDDAAPERRLYPIPTTMAKDWRSLPDWPAIHRELRRKGVTLQLVWEEYRAAHPDGYLIAWFLLALGSTIYVAYGQSAGNPKPTVMKWGFILVTLYMGPFGLLFTCWPTGSRNRDSDDRHRAKLCVATGLMLPDRGAGGIKRQTPSRWCDRNA